MYLLAILTQARSHFGVHSLQLTPLQLTTGRKFCEELWSAVVSVARQLYPSCPIWQFGRGAKGGFFLPRSFARLSVCLSVVRRPAGLVELLAGRPPAAELIRQGAGGWLAAWQG